MASNEHSGGKTTGERNQNPASDEALNAEYQKLTGELLVVQTRRTQILLEHCEDEKGLDGIEEEIRQHIRERAREGSLGYWEINQQLTVIEQEITELQRKLHELRDPLSARIARETSTTDFSR